MEEYPGWILRALAGNGHDVDWSRFTITPPTPVAPCWPLVSDVYPLLVECEPIVSVPYAPRSSSGP